MSYTPGPWQWDRWTELRAGDQPVLWACKDASYDPAIAWLSDADARLIEEAPAMADFIAGLASRTCHRGGEWVGPEGSGVGPHCHDKCSHVQARAFLVRISGEVQRPEGVANGSSK